MLPNPIRYRADAPSGYVRSRQAWILRQMRQLGGKGSCASISSISRLLRRRGWYSRQSSVAGKRHV
ncbi:hypothetical protein LOF13_13085 [Klebsiella pneumoniae subsp. pneumoniae]|nr:hypothetical protein LOF13_13085 [Klebsiella pneumoniae subsp. pneumoniae]